MTNLTFPILASCAYLFSTLLLLQDAIRQQTQGKSLWLAWIGNILHIGIITHVIIQTHTFHFSLFNIGSLITSLVSMLLLIASINKPVDKLGVAIFPIAAIMLILNQAFPSTKEQINQLFTPPLYIHILTSIIAFALLNIAALQAILLAIHEKQLRNHPPKRFILSLPPLQTMETLLFQMITTGMIFLTLSLISGFLFIDNLFAQHLAHKTVLSILAWIIFSSLLFGRISYGWRGRTAVKWTLSGFLLLLLAYFGSKLVLELILHR